MPKLTVGLTGGIASGKSLIADFFLALGVPLLDADQVSREVVQAPSPALDRIGEVFGAEFITADGQLNRPMMRQRVFADPAQRKILESILHPPMFARLQAWRDSQSAPYCILSAAILLESGLRRLVDRVLVVDVPVQTQLHRLLNRDGISEDLARGMLAAQMSREQRLQSADEVIDNSGLPEQARIQVARLHAAYLQAGSA